MDSTKLLYTTGEAVLAGDRVQFGGTYGVVVFVNDGETEEVLPGYDDYMGTDRGVVIRDDDGAITSVGDPDDRLYFIERG